MQTELHTQIDLFVRDQATGRLVFNVKAIEVLGLSPADVAQRGYRVNDAAPMTRLEERQETLR